MAWSPLGWEAAWFAEIEKFPSVVLAHQYPEVANLGDMTTIADRVTAGEVEAPDVLTGGTPCQAFSVAGMRKGLDDDRGQLSLEFCRLADAIDAVRLARGDGRSLIVWENVPGVLSSKDNAFGCFLAGLAGEDGGPLEPPGDRWTDAGCVYGPQRTVAWRVLDAQYFGLAQRRRRVWVVAGAPAGPDPTAILFEREGVRRDSAPCRETGERPAATIAGGARTSGGFSEDDLDHVASCVPEVAPTLQANGKAAGSATQQDAENGLLVFGGNNGGGAIPVAPALNAKGGSGRMDFESEALCVTGARTHALEDGTGRGTPVVAFSCKDYGSDAGDVSPTIRAMPHDVSHANGGGQVAVAFDWQSGCDARGLDPKDTAQLQRGQVPAVMTTMHVRRLTPTECERLQGFPDGYTRIPWRNKPADQCPDGPRYKALGNSWAVPCAAWIGRRIAETQNNVLAPNPSSHGGQP